MSTPVLTALVKMSFFSAFFIFCCNFQIYQRCFLIGSHKSKKEQNMKATKTEKQQQQQQQQQENTMQSKKQI